MKHNKEAYKQIAYLMEQTADVYNEVKRLRENGIAEAIGLSEVYIRIPDIPWDPIEITID